MLASVKRTKCFTIFDHCGRSKFHHTQVRSIKVSFQTAKCFGNQTMFDRLSPNISRLGRTLNRDALWLLILLFFNLFFLQFFPLKDREENALRAKRQLCDAAALMGCRIEHSLTLQSKSYTSSSLDNYGN